MTWEANDTILFGQPEGIMRLSANGGTPELIIETEEGEAVSDPQLLPGGEWDTRSGRGMDGSCFF